MQDRKLEQALEIYFQGEPDERTEEFREIQKYLRLRIRPAMEFLIENADTAHFCSFGESFFQELPVCLCHLSHS